MENCIDENVKAVLINYDDMDFCKVRLDGKSLRFFKDNFSKIESSLNQMLILRGIYELVYDGIIEGSEYI